MYAYYGAMHALNVTIVGNGIRVFNPPTAFDGDFSVSFENTIVFGSNCILSGSYLTVLDLGGNFKNGGGCPGGFGAIAATDIDNT